VTALGVAAASKIKEASATAIDGSERVAVVRDIPAVRHHLRDLGSAKYPL
jgi:hypothetical protein